MATLLIRNARLLVTMDAQRREIADGAVFARDHVIEAVGASAQLPQQADVVIDAHDQIVIPGLVNTHHHMYQTLTRVVPGAQDCELFEWLRALYPIWAKLTPQMVRRARWDETFSLFLAEACAIIDEKEEALDWLFVGVASFRIASIAII